MLQDKLSEEVQKQHDGPGESDSPPATREELDPELPASADPDASQAEEDKDKTKLLAERLKALEVTASTHALFSLLTFPLFPASLPTFSQLCSSFLLISTPRSHPSLSFVAGSSASCQSPCSAVSESMTAHQILQFSSRGEQSHPVSCRGPRAVLQPLFVFLCALGF